MKLTNKLLTSAAVAISLLAPATLVHASWKNGINEAVKAVHANRPIDYGRHKTSAKSTVSETLAESVLTDNVKRQLGGSLTFSHGSFIVNGNQPTIEYRNVAPYATNQADAMGRPTVANAVLNWTTRQYKNRQSTGNGASEWKPKGFVQRKFTSGAYRHLYDRGHLLGYALVGGIKKFNASESNTENIVTQTAWANEAGSSSNRGQNYYEGLVRKALDKNKKVRYQVKAIYEGNDLVPSGTQIQAVSSDGTIKFNVFVPNVQNGVKINYQNGLSTTN